MSKYIGLLLIDRVRQIAESDPGHVYERPAREGCMMGACQYVYQGKGSCLVGHAALELGLIDTDLERDSLNQSGVLELSSAKGWKIPSDQIDWLAVAQGAQDDGETWGEAVALADQEFPVPSLV